MVWNFRVLPLANVAEERIHIFANEGGLEREHLVNNHSERPDIARVVIVAISPNLGRGVVRCASLRLVHDVFLNF